MIALKLFHFGAEIKVPFPGGQVAPCNASHTQRAHVCLQAEKSEPLE